MRALFLGLVPSLATFVAIGATEPTEQSIADWVPRTLLVSIAVGAISVAAALLKSRATGAEARLAGVEAKMQALLERVSQLATNDGLGRMGERLEARIANVTERVAVLEALERRKPQ